MLLIISDRDGTLIKSIDYLGKEDDWKDKIKLNLPTIDLLNYIQKKCLSKIFVITNQQGVARKYFDCAKVEKINLYLNKKLMQLGIKINGWNYCPDVDYNYVKLHPEIEFDPNNIKKETNRKPSRNMILEILNKKRLSLTSFKQILVLGDDEDDEKLAENLKGGSIDVRKKEYKQLEEEFLSFINKD